MNLYYISLGLDYNLYIQRDNELRYFIVITDRSDSARVLINKKKVFEGILDSMIVGDKEMMEMLTYQM